MWDQLVLVGAGLEVTFSLQSGQVGPNYTEALEALQFQALYSLEDGAEQ